MSDNAKVVMSENNENIVALEKKIQEKTLELTQKEQVITELMAKVDTFSDKVQTYEKVIEQMMLDGVEKEAVIDAERISNKFKSEAKDAVRKFMSTIRKIDKIKGFGKGEYDLTVEFAKIVDSINFEGNALLGEKGHAIPKTNTESYEFETEEVSTDMPISTKFFNSLRHDEGMNEKVLKYSKEKNISFTEAFMEMTNKGIID